MFGESVNAQSETSGRVNELKSLGTPVLDVVELKLSIVQ